MGNTQTNLPTNLPQPVLQCSRCKETGLYYYCEGDLQAQLWASGGQRWNVSELQDGIRKYAPLPEVPDDSPHWQAEKRKSFVRDQKRSLLSTFLKLHQDKRNAATLFAESPRYQTQCRMAPLAKQIHETLPLPVDLSEIILQYSQSPVRYLFPLSEKLHPDDLSCRHGTTWTSVEDLLLRLPRLHENPFWDIPRRRDAYCLEPPSLKQDNYLPRLSDWTSGIWDGEDKIPRRMILWCNVCILGNISELGKYVNLDFAQSRKPIQEWNCIHDDRLFHENNEKVFKQLFRRWLRND
jgi:hypothetical protein